MSHFQTKVLLSPHLCSISVGLVFVTDEMQDTMRQNAVELVPERPSELLGVVANPVNADIKLARKKLRTVVQRKRDDVGVEVVVHALHVEVIQALIRAEHVIQLSDFPAVFGDETLYPLFRQTLVKFGLLNVNRLKPYHFSKNIRLSFLCKTVDTQ